MKLRFGVIAAVFLAIFCLYPQFKMLYLRGEAWNGHYAYNDIDEVAYASYLRALIDGRPRRNDPYSGRDDTAHDPQPESLFSIQFAAPYSVAIPARLLGIGAPWAMTLSGAVAGFLAALAAFWLIFAITGNNWYSMAGSLVVFAGGAAFAGEGAALEVFFDGFSYPYFPGFRRYIPAMAMPAIFALFGTVWALLSTGQEVPRRRAEVLLTGASIGLFAFTVFSYFYIWTTAAAWLAGLVLIWLVFQPNEFRRDLRFLIATAGGCILVLLPYAYLLSNRSHTMDDVQLLVHTRMPDLWRMPEYVSVLCLVLIAAGVGGRVISLRDRATLFTLSLVVVPFIVFNQQIITGRSLQPIHYQVFIGNYVAGLGLVLTVGILARKFLARSGRAINAACAALAVAAVVWGFVECHYTVRVLDDANVERDVALPVARRLEELAAADSDPYRSTVLAYDMIQADDLPTVAPQNVLWARHQHVFAGLTWEQNKERYYQYLYYSNVDEEGLEWLLKNDFVSQIALFGWGRHTDRLSFDAKPLTFGEIAEEVRRYGEYRATFGVGEAAAPRLSYVVVNEEMGTDLSNLDRWYVRDAGESFGKYTLYRLTLRSR